MKLHRYSTNCLNFHCPGCGYDHSVAPSPEKNSQQASWNWNGSMDKPTFTPSILVFGSDPKARCHSYVTNGRIQFLGDCFHSLKGQTVDIPDYDMETP